ncbi:ParA family protein [uncultured Arthrobacter sp.]|uniref:ParA family protein n=1 Tax=uncultured Arthrobacter sp. TaxID=114050 RepID=UPI003216A85F
MNAMTAIATVELRRFLRDRSNIFFVFIFPLMLILLLGSQFGAGSGQARVVISGPGSALAQALTAELESSGADVTATDADAARTDLSRGRADVGLFLDDGDAEAFDAGKPAELDVVMAPQSSGQAVLQQVRTAVQALIIPIQCEYYGLEGISQLLNTVRLVQQNINPGLAIGGVLLTMYDSRLNLCRQVAEDATEYFGPKVFGTPIPRNVRLAEAPSHTQPITAYDSHSAGAQDYRAVAAEFEARGPA